MQVALRGGVPQSPSITAFSAVYGPMSDDESDEAAQQAVAGQLNGQAPGQPSGGVL